ncbi:MAG: hypothetical protein AB1489_19420 [Acidobacteriota bacterium]
MVKDPLVIFDLFKIATPIILVILALLLPRATNQWLRQLEGKFTSIAQQKQLSILLIGLVTILANAAVSLLLFIPVPFVHDEFSYLLAADTFANGRITNPTHPLWIHFESLQIIQQPTYASKYPPAQGLILAVGQVIGGHPIVGVWLSMGLVCAIICWMLQAWLPPRWALMGSLLAMLRLGILGYWSQSYWGGAMAAIGGALLFGALPRLIRQPQVSVSLLMGLGLAILANSRPYEGLIISLPVLIVLLVWMLKNQSFTGWILFKRIVLPLVILLAITGTMMGYYNWRVTGNPLLMPYQVHETTYSVAPIFIWQPLRPEPQYNHKAIRDFHITWGLTNYQSHYPLSNLIITIWNKLKTHWSFFLGPMFTIPLITLPWVLRNRWIRLALLTSLLCLLAIIFETYTTQPHYLAPITSLVFLIVVQSMRHLRLWCWRGKPTGRFIVCMVPLFAILVLIVRLQLGLDTLDANSWNVRRASLQKQLEADEKFHLIIVRYGAKHNLHHEWVYNNADINSAKVVWARDIDDRQNCALIRYFYDRQVWLLNIDDQSIPQLIPYPTNPCQ